MFLWGIRYFWGGVFRNCTVFRIVHWLAWATSFLMWQFQHSIIKVVSDSRVIVIPFQVNLVLVLSANFWKMNTSDVLIWNHFFGRTPSNCLLMKCTPGWKSNGEEQVIFKSQIKRYIFLKFLTLTSKRENWAGIEDSAPCLGRGVKKKPEWCL